MIITDNRIIKNAFEQIWRADRRVMKGEEGPFAGITGRVFNLRNGPVQ